MRLMLWKRAYRLLRLPQREPFVNMAAGSLVEGATTACMHAGTAQVEGRTLTAMVVSAADEPRFMAVSHGDGTVSIAATPDTVAVLDEHWPDWKEDRE